MTDNQRRAAVRKVRKRSVAAVVGHRQHIDVDIGFLLDVPVSRLFFDVAVNRKEASSKSRRMTSEQFVEVLERSSGPSTGARLRLPIHK
jgi:hypothetical protein